MNDTIIALKAKEQLGKFLGKVFTHFRKPAKKFMFDMLYGIQASGDTQLSAIMRSINNDPDKRHSVEKRLSRNISSPELCDSINEALLAEGVRHIKDNTLILVDPTEIRKEFANHMEYVTTVRDASRSSKEGKEVLVKGYQGCMVVACQSGIRKTIPLALDLWSSRAPGFKGETDEVLKIIYRIMKTTGGKGTIVYDRGGDRRPFYEAFIDNSYNFIVRMKSRSVISWKAPYEIHELAAQCKMQHSYHVKFDSHGKECNIPISFGTLPVKLPFRPDTQLHMVVVNGFGKDPLMLLTSLPVSTTFESQWRIVEGYLSRWRIEETIRFVKQSYKFENMRVLSYQGIKNMSSIVLATAYFATVWIGRHMKREVLAEHLKTLSQRLSDVPEFANYALADGIKRAFARIKSLVRKVIDPPPVSQQEMLYQPLPGFEEFFPSGSC